MKTPLKHKSESKQKDERNVSFNVSQQELKGRQSVIESSLYGGSVLAIAVAAAAVGVVAKQRMEVVALLAFGVAIVTATAALVQCFLFPLGEMRGLAATRRRTARQFRQTQEKCESLIKEVEESMEQGAPIEHLRAAEQHLRMVEAWLVAKTGSDSFEGNSLQRPRLNSVATIRQELRLPKDRDYDEQQVEFLELFQPISDGEALAIVLPCLIKSGPIRHHGKLYLTSARVCLHSPFFGAEILVSNSWNEIAQVRLMDMSERNMYCVRFHFKKEIEFDGTGIEHFDINIFDILAVGHVDRCATYFTGSGLFGMWQKRTR